MNAEAATPASTWKCFCYMRACEMPAMQKDLEGLGKIETARVTIEAAHKHFILQMQLVDPPQPALMNIW